MKRRIRILAAVCVCAALFTGCQGNKEKYTYRETGISQLDAGNYEEAIQSFDQALEHSDGTVGEFELDVLKYRAEAEYKAEDYAAAAYTYGILIQVDGPRPEYISMQNMLYIQAGELDKAMEAYLAVYGPESGSADAGSTVKDKEAGKKSGDGKKSDGGKKNGDGKKAGSDEASTDTLRQTLLLSLGQALTEAERFEDARTLYRQAIDDGVQSGELYNRMGLCELEDGKLDDALGYFTQGMQIPDETAKPKLLYNQAAVYEQKQDFAKALELLETFVASYGSTPEAEKEIAFLKTR